MTDILQVDNIKGSIITNESLLQPRGCYVTYCQVCEWYGYPLEKIIRQFEDIRPEQEDGFVDKFTEYNYDTETGQRGTKHVHKYDPTLIQELVDLALKIRNSGEEGQE
jgi:hypothetical protein